MLGSREYIVSRMAHLWCLDEFIVQDFERKPYSDYYPIESFRGERLKQLSRFKPFNAKSMTWQPWPLPGSNNRRGSGYRNLSKNSPNLPKKKVSPQKMGRKFSIKCLKEVGSLPMLKINKLKTVNAGSDSKHLKSSFYSESKFMALTNKN